MKRQQGRGRGEVATLTKALLRVVTRTVVADTKCIIVELCLDRAGETTAVRVGAWSSVSAG